MNKKCAQITGWWQRMNSWQCKHQQDRWKDCFPPPGHFRSHAPQHWLGVMVMHVELEELTGFSSQASPPFEFLWRLVIHYLCMCRSRKNQGFGWVVNSKGRFGLILTQFCSEFCLQIQEDLVNHSIGLVDQLFMFFGIPSRYIKGVYGIIYHVV